VEKRGIKRWIVHKHKNREDVITIAEIETEEVALETEEDLAQAHIKEEAEDVEAQVMKIKEATQDQIRDSRIIYYNILLSSFML